MVLEGIWGDLEALPFGYNLDLWGVSGAKDTHREYCARIVAWSDMTGDTLSPWIEPSNAPTIEEAVRAAIDDFKRRQLNGS